MLCTIFRFYILYASYLFNNYPIAFFIFYLYNQGVQRSYGTKLLFIFTPLLDFPELSGQQHREVLLFGGDTGHPRRGLPGIFLHAPEKSGSSY